MHKQYLESLCPENQDMPQKAMLQGLVLQACSDFSERHAKCSEVEVQVCSAKLRYGSNIF